MGEFETLFGAVPDPRAANATHRLSTILFIALAATLCGGESCEDMAEFADAKRTLLRRFVELGDHGPSHDTFSRLFRLLDAQRFETTLHAFTAQFAAQIRGVVALDGKAVRRAYGREGATSPLHLVSAFAAEARLVLAQRKAPKRNETAAAREVLELLALEGCTVTADALFCYPSMAKAIRARGGDYAIVLKSNNGPLYRHAKRQFARQLRSRAATTRERRHGRSEQRRARVLADPQLAQSFRFPGLAALGEIQASRRVGGRSTTTTRYFVLSRPLTAQQLLDTARAHWSIENSLHWVLDVVMDEDRARSRTDNGPENLAVLRRLALNIVRRDASKSSLRRKFKRAGWDDDFFISLWTHMR
jgi:predicted transposase YbfD/YdcC